MAGSSNFSRERICDEWKPTSCLKASDNGTQVADSQLLLTQSQKTFTGSQKFHDLDEFLSLWQNERVFLKKVFQNLDENRSEPKTRSLECITFCQSIIQKTPQRMLKTDDITHCFTTDLTAPSGLDSDINAVTGKLPLGISMKQQSLWSRIWEFLDAFVHGNKRRPIFQKRLSSSHMQKLQEKAVLFSKGNKHLAALIVEGGIEESESAIRRYLSAHVKAIYSIKNESIRNSEVSRMTSAIINGWLIGLSSLDSSGTDAMSLLLCESVQSFYKIRIDELENHGLALIAKSVSNDHDSEALRSNLDTIKAEAESVVGEGREERILSLEDRSKLLNLIEKIDERLSSLYLREKLFQSRNECIRMIERSAIGLKQARESYEDLWNACENSRLIESDRRWIAGQVKELASFIDQAFHQNRPFKSRYFKFQSSSMPAGVSLKKYDNNWIKVIFPNNQSLKLGNIRNVGHGIEFSFRLKVIARKDKIKGCFLPSPDSLREKSEAEIQSLLVSLPDSLRSGIEENDVGDFLKNYDGMYHLLEKIPQHLQHVDEPHQLGEFCLSSTSSSSDSLEEASLLSHLMDAGFLDSLKNLNGRPLFLLGNPPIEIGKSVKVPAAKGYYELSRGSAHPIIQVKYISHFALRKESKRHFTIKFESEMASQDLIRLALDIATDPKLQDRYLRVGGTEFILAAINRLEETSSLESTVDPLISNVTKRLDVLFKYFQHFKNKINADTNLTETVLTMTNPSDPDTLSELINKTTDSLLLSREGWLRMLGKNAILSSDMGLLEEMTYEETIGVISAHIGQIYLASQMEMEWEIEGARFSGSLSTTDRIRLSVFRDLGFLRDSGESEYGVQNRSDLFKVSEDILTMTKEQLLICKEQSPLPRVASLLKRYYRAIAKFIETQSPSRQYLDRWDLDRDNQVSLAREELESYLIKRTLNLLNVSLVEKEIHNEKLRSVIDKRVRNEIIFAIRSFLEDPEYVRLFSKRLQLYKNNL